MMSDDEKLSSFLSIESIDDDFFCEIVERRLNVARDKFKLRFVYVAPATGKNENFASVVYRAKIGIEMIATKERQFVSVIVKALLTTIKEIKEFGVFPRERFMYEDVIGSFEKILEEKAGEKIEFGPQCLAIHSEPYEIIVLEDLKASGFQVIDRKVGANLQQAMMVMKKLAKFHAASVIRHQTDGIVRECLDRNASVPRFPKDGPIGETMSRMYYAFLDGIKTRNVPASCIEKVSKWDTSDMLDVYFLGCSPMKCGFQVLNHGDDWITNMMFKVEEDGETSAMKFLDFQMSFWGTPIVDLFYFIMSSVRDDVKVDYFDEFIETYQRELESTLKKMNYSGIIPTVKDIYEDMEDKKELVIGQCMGIMFICKYTSDVEINLGEIFSGYVDEESLKRMYCNENYLKALELWLVFFDKRGYLDAYKPRDN